jgi:hypothetical protein
MKEAATLRYGAPEDVGMSTARLRRVSQLAEGLVTRAVHSALVVLIAQRRRRPPGGVRAPDPGSRFPTTPD